MWRKIFYIAADTDTVTKQSLDHRNIIEKIGDTIAGWFGNGSKQFGSAPQKFFNLQELFSQGEWEHDFGKDITDADSAVRMGQFYEQWSVYLTPNAQYMVGLAELPVFLMKGLYNLSHVIEEAYMALFKLFGFFDYLNDQGSVIGKLYTGLQIAGVAVFTMLLVLKITASFLSRPPRYADMLNSLLLATLISAFLPLALNVGGAMTAQVSQSVMQVSENGNTKSNSISIIPVQNNVVDVLQLIRADFDVDKLGQDSKGYVSYNSDFAKSNGLNQITDDNLNNTRFAEWYGASDEETLKWFKEESGYNEGIITLFTHSMVTSADDFVQIGTLKKKAWYESFAEGLTPVYSRYVINFIPLYLQQAMLIFILLFLGIKLVRTIVTLLVGGVVAPFAAFMKVGDPQGIKDMLNSFFASYVGIVVDVILLRVAMIVLRDGSNMVTSNLGFWESMAATLMIYTGVFMSVLYGNQMVNDMFRGNFASAGGAGMYKEVLGAYAINRGVNDFAKSLGNTVSDIAKAPSKGIEAVSKTAGKAQGISDAVQANGGGIKGAAQALANNANAKGAEARRNAYYNGQNKNKSGKDFDQYNPLAHGVSQPNQHNEKNNNLFNDVDKGNSSNSSGGGVAIPTSSSSESSGVENGTSNISNGNGVAGTGISELNLQSNDTNIPSTPSMNQSEATGVENVSSNNSNWNRNGDVTISEPTTMSINQSDVKGLEEMTKMNQKVDGLRKHEVDGTRDIEDL